MNLRKPVEIALGFEFEVRLSARLIGAKCKNPNPDPENSQKPDSPRVVHLNPKSQRTKQLRVWV